jgi:hypothetical protein
MKKLVSLAVLGAFLTVAVGCSGSSTPSKPATPPPPPPKAGGSPATPK